MKRFIVLLISLACVNLINSMEELPVQRPSAKMPLWEAANTGDVETVKWYIANRVDLNSPSPGGESALMLAATTGNEEIVKLLLAAGASLNIRNLNGHTALHFALFQRHSAIAQALIEAGANVNIADNSKKTPLMAAAAKGVDELLQPLIAAGARLSDVDNRGNTARDVAIIHRHNSTVQILDEAMRQGSVPQVQKAKPMPTVPIWQAALNDDLDAVKWYVANRTTKGIDINSVNPAGGSALMIAAARHNLDMVKLLLNAGANPNIRDGQGHTALYHTCMGGGNVAIAKALIEAGADVNIKTNDKLTPLIMAVSVDNKDLVQLLVDNGADLDAVDAWGRDAHKNALQHTIHRSRDIVQILNQARDRQEAKGPRTGNSGDFAIGASSAPVIPLWQAALNGDVGAVKWYIAHRGAKGVDINAVSPGGESPLMNAATTGNEEIAKLLLDAGANLKIQNVVGATALHHAVSGCGNFNIARALIVAGANVNAKMNSKSTPLIMAIMNLSNRKTPDLVELLLNSGATLDDRSDLGWSARDWAKQLNRRDVVEMLDQAYQKRAEASDDEEEYSQECSEEGGEDEGSTDDEALPSLWTSAIQGDRELLLWHLQNGESVDARNRYDETPLMLAAQNGHEEIINELLAHGAQPNLIDQDGDTALMWAIRKNREACAKLLINIGADTNIANYAGETAWWLAHEEYLFKLGDSLVAAGANVHYSLGAIAEGQKRERMYEKEDALIKKKNVKAGKYVPDISIWQSAETGDLDAINLYLKNQPARADSSAANAQETPAQLKLWIADAEQMLLENKGSKEDLLESIETYRERLRMLESGEEQIIARNILNEQNAEGETPLMVAAANGQNEIAKVLVEAGVQLNVVDENGNIALMRALMASDRQPYRKPGPRIYIRSGSDDEEFESDSEEKLPEEGTQVVIAKILLNAGADWKIKNHLHQNALFIAVQQGRAQIVELLVAAGADPNQITEGDYDYTMLMVAAYLHRLDAIKALVKSGANINATDDDGVTALMIAATRPDFRTVDLLLKLGASVEARDILGRTALDYAKRSGNEHDIALLEKAEENVVQPLVTTPLIRAVNRGEIDTVKKILAHKVNINEQDAEGTSPLSAAARSGNLKLVELFLANGADVDTRNKDGLRPLHSAVMGGYMEIAHLLINRGADTNAPDDYRNRTPLHWAVRMTQGSVQKLARQVPVETSARLIRLLLEKGADASRLDYQGKTALEWSENQHLQPLIEILAPVTPARPRPQVVKNAAKIAQPKVAPKKAGKAAQQIVPPVKQKAKAPKNIPPAQPKAAKAQPGKQAQNPKAAPAQPKAKAAKQVAPPVKQKAQPVKGAVKAPQAPAGPTAQEAEAARRKEQSEMDKAINKAKKAKAAPNKKPQPQNIKNNNNLGWLLDLSHAAPSRVAHLSVQGI